MNNFNNHSSCNLDKLHCAATCGAGEYLYSPLQAKNALSVTNNRAKYYSDLAESYKNEAKTFRDNAKLYAEQNADVTMEYVNNLAADIENKLAGKQPVGDYVTTSKMEESTVTPTELSTAIESVTLPSMENNSGKILSNNGNSVYWKEEDFGANTELSNLSETGEAKFAAKVNTDLSNCTKPYILETYQNSASGYIVYSNNYCEQWGRFYGYRNSFITYLKSYPNNVAPNIQLTMWVVGGNTVVAFSNPQANGFTLTSEYTGGDLIAYWRVSGYLAS